MKNYTNLLLEISDDFYTISVHDIIFTAGLMELGIHKILKILLVSDQTLSILTPQYMLAVQMKLKNMEI